MESTVKLIHLEGVVYADVNGFVGAIVQDLMKAPDDMVANRAEIIYALHRYAADATGTMEEV